MIELLQRSDFHGAELARVFSEGADTCLLFRNIILSTSDGKYFTAKVRLRDVERLTQNGTVVEQFELQGAWSSVLAFDRQPSHAVLTIIWRSKTFADDIVDRYEFRFTSLELIGEEQDDLII